MKRTKSIISLILVVVLMLSLTVTAWAKTSSEAIEAPADDATVFQVKVGSKTVDFTWADVNGKGDFETATDEYAAKVDGEQSIQEWTGVMLSDMLAAVETKLDVKFNDDYKIKAVAADDYVVSFTVGDVKDADNRYMVAGDPSKNLDGDTNYENSYVRILRGEATALSNFANIRCIISIEVLDASGNAIVVDSGKTQGGDVENAVFYIAVKESADSDMKFYYYTKADLEAYNETHDFKYVDHTVAKTVTGKGALMSSLLADISDAEITDDMIIQYAESDGYHADAATAIDDSDYKDKVAWLDNTHVTAGGETAAAVDTMVCAYTWTKYDNPDETNVDSTEWEDADAGSGYLRAYRQRDDANSAVIKTLMGAVVSYSGQEFTGKDGYTLKAASTNGKALQIIEPSTGIVYESQKITGLVPGMKYAVYAPDITNASIASSCDSKQIITAAEGVGTAVTFTYEEAPYFAVTADGKTTQYAYSEFRTLDAATQTPSKEEVEAHGTPYGYYNAMYYRYQGAWLSDLVGNTKDVTIVAADGSTATVKASDVDNYFVAYGYTASKSSTNVGENKRFTYSYEVPMVIIPSDGTLVGADEAKAEGNKMVTVAVKAAKNVIVGEAVTSFTDLGNYKWAKDAIASLEAQGVVDGIGNNQYGPALNIKRGDFMLMIYRAYNLEADVDGCFKDVPEESYYYDAIAVGKALGIVKGDGGEFRPKDAVTRQEAMAMLYRALNVAGVDMSKYKGSLDSFSDASNVSSWAKESIAALVDAGIINGNGGKMLPKDNLTRAEMAVALFRAMTTM